MAVLLVEDLRKSFNNKPPVVRGVSFKVEAGEIHAFLGPNGAGKTTTIKMIAGLLVPDTGVVRIDGFDPHAGSAAMSRIGTVLEGNRNLYWRMTPFENLRYFGVHKGMSIKAASVRAEELLERFSLMHKRNAQVSSLSRGMQQKLAIAVTLTHKPKLLLLDEPTLGLDVMASIHITQTIRDLRSEGMAIVLTTHQLDVAETLADRISIIREGLIVKQATKEALMEEYSPNCYEIKLTTPLCESRSAALVERFGAEIGEGIVRLPGGSDTLYEALSVINPVPVDSLGRVQPDLTQIFLRITEEQFDHA